MNNNISLPWRFFALKMWHAWCNVHLRVGKQKQGSDKTSGDVFCTANINWNINIWQQISNETSLPLPLLFLLFSNLLCSTISFLAICLWSMLSNALNYSKRTKLEWRPICEGDGTQGSLNILFDFQCHAFISLLIRWSFSGTLNHLCTKMKELSELWLKKNSSIKYIMNVWKVHIYYAS